MYIYTYIYIYIYMHAFFLTGRDRGSLLPPAKNPY